MLGRRRVVLRGERIDHMKDRLFFCHIPKTGGTSLRNALEATYQPWQVLPDEFMMARLGGRYADLVPMVHVYREARDAVRLVRAHWHISCASLFDASSAVILRDPYERTVSHLRHILRHGEISRPRLAQMLSRGALPIPDNVQARFLAGSVGPFDHQLYERHIALLFGPRSSRFQ